MSPAFVPGAAPGAFTAAPRAPCTSARPARAGPRMAYNEVGPDTRKYLSYIPVDRLNKAPLISVNAIPGPSDAYNSVSVQLVDMPRDEAAGDSLKAGVYVDPSLIDDAPAPAKYEKYFPRETLHEAPLISIQDGGTDLKRSMLIVQCEIPTSIVEAEAVKGDGVPPNPMLYSKMDNPTLNKAPCVEVLQGETEEGSVVQTPFATIPLDYVGASIIFNKYKTQ